MILNYNIITYWLKLCIYKSILLNWENIREFLMQICNSSKKIKHNVLQVCFQLLMGDRKSQTLCILVSFIDWQQICDYILRDSFHQIAEICVRKAWMKVLESRINVYCYINYYTYLYRMSHVQSVASIFVCVVCIAKVTAVGLSFFKILCFAISREIVLIIVYWNFRAKYGLTHSNRT